MKIGIDIRNFGRKRTGDETVFFNLVKQLVSLDSINDYFLFIDQRTTEEIDAIARSLDIFGKKKNFRFVSLKTSGKFDWNLRALPTYLRRHPVDVYHTQYITPFLLPRKIKVVTHIHDISFQAYPEYLHWKDRWLLRVLIPLSMRRADKVIAVSDFTRQEILRSYTIASEKVAVIPNAPGEDFQAQLASSDTERIRNKYHLPEKFILYVGTLQPRKNIPALIKAYAKMIQSRPEISDIALVIVGNRTGHHFDVEIDRVMQGQPWKKNIYFPGYIEQSDLPAVFRLAHVFAFPSLYEGFGIPLLEAMSQDVPTIASDIPCLREIAGDASCFVEPNDVARFAEILYTVSIESDVRQKLIAAGKQRVRDFSWLQSAKKLLELYQALHKNKG